MSLPETSWYQLRRSSKENSEIKYHGLDIRGFAASIKKKCALFGIDEILTALQSNEVPKEIVVDLDILRAKEVTNFANFASCLEHVNNLCETSPELKEKVIPLRVSQKAHGPWLAKLWDEIFQSFEWNDKKSGCSYDLRLTGKQTRLATFLSKRLKLVALDLTGHELVRNYNEYNFVDFGLVEELFTSLETQPELKVLNLKAAMQPIKWVCYTHYAGDALMMQFLSHLSKLDRLEILDMSSNFLGPEGAKTILKSVSKLPLNLKQLNFGDNNFGRKGTAEILESLAQHQQLEVLNLSGNTNLKVWAHSSFLQRNHIEKIEHYLKNIDFLPKLKHLDLRGNGMGPTVTFKILKALSKRKKLRVLNLAENDLGYSGAENVATILKNKNFAPKFTQLNLRGNNMGFNGIMEVLKSLVNQKKLRVLDIGKDRSGRNEKTLTPLEAEELGKLLLQNEDIANSLQQLNLNELITTVEGTESMSRLAETRSGFRVTVSLNLD